MGARSFYLFLEISWLVLYIVVQPWYCAMACQSASRFWLLFKSAVYGPVVLGGTTLTTGWQKMLSI